MKDDLRDRVEDALPGHDARYIETHLDETDTTRVLYRGLELEEVACNTGIGNGEIIGRVKDTVISGNGYSALRNIEAIEDTAHWVGGAVKTPAVVACGISVSTEYIEKAR